MGAPEFFQSFIASFAMKPEVSGGTDSVILALSGFPVEAAGKLPGKINTEPR